MSVTSPIFLSSVPITSVPLNFDARYWSCRCELMNFAEVVDGKAVELADGAAVLIDGDVEDGCEDVDDGCVISVDLAAGAGLGDFMSSAANAEPTIKPPMAVVIMSFFSIGDPPWTYSGNSGNPLLKTTFGHMRCSGKIAGGT